MKTSDIINLLHNAIEAENLGKKISQQKMADTFGISMRTYQEWRLGSSAPLAIPVVFNMLGALKDEDIIRLVRKINAGQKDAR
ncbi:MAG: XRE family transcriptional regulator [Sulfurospirillaceae bacterium]|jgi:transcriptional regulator with XRE-family HTH domain|nr:XRE family transcriptional regulator [Sulfurospirillaceae bacterium]MDD2826674.1 XRE family transcriptional regulator [Sulfurospirillaceae bacterium]